MLSKIKGIISLVMLANRQKEASEGAGNVLLKRKIKALEIDLAMFKEVAKARYALIDPLNAKIKALESQNSYLRDTSSLMRETIEAQIEALNGQSRDDKTDFSEKCRKEAERLYPTKNSSSFDSKNT